MEFNESKHVISKRLSSNDIGKNGAHQSGILIPKNPKILSLFPNLPINVKNPRVKLKFKDINDKEWFFSFIYYNNRLFGGTRNEYRLTCMTSFIKQNDLEIGDEVIFSMNEFCERHIWYKHAFSSHTLRDGVIRLSNNWKIIRLKED